jgi:hypothetical protein
MIKAKTAATNSFHGSTVRNGKIGRQGRDNHPKVPIGSLKIALGRSISSLCRSTAFS